MNQNNSNFKNKTESTYHPKSFQVICKVYLTENKTHEKRNIS